MQQINPGLLVWAAVVARGWGKCCVVGLDALDIDYNSKTCSIAGRTFSEGDDISIDGFTGELLLGHVDTSARLRRSLQKKSDNLNSQNK